jgi:hypothetical protein
MSTVNRDTSRLNINQVSRDPSFLISHDATNEKFKTVTKTVSDLKKLSQKDL